MRFVLYQPDGPVPGRGHFAGLKPTVLAMENSAGECFRADHVDAEQLRIALARGVPLVTKPAIVFDAIVITPTFGE